MELFVAPMDLFVEKNCDLCRNPSIHPMSASVIAYTSEKATFFL